MLEITELHAGKGAVCRDILESLPEWFGIPSSIDGYVYGVESQPMIVCREPEQHRIVGFVSLRFHGEFAAEAYVLGIRREWHRCGAGTKLFRAAEQMARDQGMRFLTVKTLAPTKPNPFYSITRRFYEKIGFVPLEILPTFWGPNNPCLMMIKQL